MSNDPRTPNDQRSIVKNPQSSEFQADRANRSKLGHPDVPPPPAALEHVAPPKPKAR